MNCTRVPSQRARFISAHARDLAFLMSATAVYVNLVDCNLYATEMCGDNGAILTDFHYCVHPGNIQDTMHNEAMCVSGMDGTDDS
jgi:hypothetical protein